MSELIERQAAIGLTSKCAVDTNPDHFQAHQKFIQFMGDEEISSFGNWQWSNGYNTALVAMRVDLRNLPPAQPEIIHCCECKFFRANMSPDGYLPKGAFEFECKHWNGSCDPTDFCSNAERRTDD